MQRHAPCIIPYTIVVHTHETLLAFIHLVGDVLHAYICMYIKRIIVYLCGAHITARVV